MNVSRPWTVYRTRFLVQARQLTQPMVFVDVLGREQSGQPGDYLVESSEGFRHITPRAAFEDIYVPLDSGAMVPKKPVARQAPTPDRERDIHRHGSGWMEARS